MNLPDFRSSLADPLSRFLQFKQALNRKYRTEAAALRLFDGYLCEHNVADWKAIDSAMIDDFLISRPRTRPRSYNHLLGVLHRFFAFAIMQQWTRQNPVTARPRRNTGNRIPYLFDLCDAKSLLAVSRGLPDKPRAPLRGLVYEMIFALLYGLGMRVGEVARLRLSDADLVCDTLFIRDTKFSKSRIVPMGPKLAERLKRYIEECHGSTEGPDIPLFSFTERGCIHEGTISHTFHTLVPKLNLHIPPGVSSPRVHDLRHAFAVATLLRWYREGVDPNCRLIHLATFLGHVDPNSTAVYLTITEDLLYEAAQRFQVMAPKGGMR
jgi:site-specific recombinase XerD